MPSLMTVTTLKARIAAELNLLGTFTDTVQTTMIREAVIRFCRKMDKPIISASLAVTADSAGPYSVPATLSKLVSIYDGTTVKHYSFNTDKNTVTFTDDCEPDTTENWTAYGTPAEINTNLTATVAGMSENYEDVLWEYIRAFALRISGDQSGYISELQAADKSVRELRKSINRNLDQNGMPVQFIDVQGSTIGDASNAEGVDIAIDNDLESDL